VCNLGGFSARGAHHLEELVRSEEGGSVLVKEHLGFLRMVPSIICSLFWRRLSLQFISWILA
jgi:hypothetical protein